MKKLDQVLNISLWVIFAAICGGLLFIVAPAISAPDYEVASLDTKFNYQFDSDDGNIIESHYLLAWHYKKSSFRAPTVVAYDPVYKNVASIKDEYVDEHKTTMSPPSYKVWQRWFWVYFIVMAIVAAIVVYFGGGALRDYIVFSFVRNHNTFAGYAYFLYDDRLVCKRQAKKYLSLTIDKYIVEKMVDIGRRYQPAFATLIQTLLNEIKQQGDTNIAFYYSYLDNTKDPLTYLKQLSLFWESQQGIEPEAEKRIEAIDSIRQKSFAPMEIAVTAQDCVNIVTEEIKELFSNVMGEEVFNFNAYSSAYANARKQNGSIFLETKVENDSSTFTWSGSSYSGKVFGGVAVRFTIYHYKGNNKVILWNKHLPSKCTYKAKDEDFKVVDLYSNMIKETIRSFPESLQKV